MSYYQTTARVDRIMENGEQKKISEKFLADALTCFEAIEHTTAELHSTTNGEFEITEVKKTAIAEVLGNLEAEKFFLAKINLITVDERTAKEKKTTVQWFVGADDYDIAKAEVTDEIKRSMADIEIAGLVESPIVGYIPAKL